MGLANQIFDFQKLNQNIKPFRKDNNPQETTKQDGLLKVIKYVWNHYPTASVNFDSFSQEDVQEALRYLTYIPGIEDDEDEDIVTFSGIDGETENINPWEENAQIENICYALHKNRNIIYENDDDFI